MPRFSNISFWEFPFHLILFMEVPDFLIEWPTFCKFLDFPEPFPGKSLCHLPPVWKFWNSLLNRKRPYIFAFVYDELKPSMYLSEFRCVFFFFWICFISNFFQVLIGITSSGKPLRGFNAKELLPAECLSSLVGLLSESNVKPSLHTKAVVLLFNLGE